MLINYDKCKIDTIEVAGFKTALFGMREPMNSHQYADSTFENGRIIIGDKDLRLANNLSKSGPEERKFLRQIYVSARIVLPRSVLVELDTYKVGTTCNSSSTMHKLLNNKNLITTDQFVYDSRTEVELLMTIEKLNELREAYLNEKDLNKKNEILVAAKMILPEGFLAPRTMTFTGENLRNIYYQRVDHRMSMFWKNIVCRWIESIPYAKEVILYNGEEDPDNE